MSTDKKEIRRKEIQAELTVLEDKVQNLRLELTNLNKQDSAIIEQRLKKAMSGNGDFSTEELTFSAHATCDCGAGLCYPKKIGVRGSWYCSLILLGKASKDMRHTAPLPFSFYNIKSENNVNKDYQMRTYQKDGEDFLIVPVVMMKEGVHNGSSGPLFHSSEELSKSVSNWNGKPIVVYHPEGKDGGFISASDLPEEEQIGIIMNSRMEGDKLKAEAWIRVNRLNETYPQVLTHIQNKNPLDVSVGELCGIDEQEGEWNGKQYKGLAVNIQADHLALLPGLEGACSWKDGCGVRNQKNNLEERKNVRVLNGLTTNAELSFDQIRNLIRAYLSTMEISNSNGGGHKWLYANEVYDSYFIYEVEDSTVTPPTEKYFKQAYTLDASNNLQLVGDPIQVKKVVQYIVINTNNKKSKMTPCCKQKIDALIANAKTPWKESDRKWLEAQEENVVNNIADSVVESDPQKLSTEEVMNTVRNSIKTTEDFLNLIPDNQMREQMKQGLVMHQAQKSEMMSYIVNNSKGVWTEDTLKEANYDFKTISNLAKSLGYAETRVDYSAAVNNEHTPTSKKGTVLAPMGVTFKKAE